jgi:hypothetical protein
VLPVETQLGACLSSVSVAYGRNNQAQQWTAFEPGAPATLQTLSELVPGGAYLVNVEGDCMLAHALGSIALYAGWNLIGWRDSQSEGGASIEAQVGACVANTNIAYGHDNQAKKWLAFQPGAPGFLQTLSAFSSAGGYLLNATADCLIASSDNSVEIYTGWNLFGWE